MTTDESPLVEFLCREEHTEQAPDPVTAAHQFPRLLRDQAIPRNYAEAAQKDHKLTDAVTHGWYLYPPETVTLTETTDQTVQVTSGKQFVTTEDTPIESLWTGTINTLWHITVPTGYVILVTNPTYRPDGPISPQVFTSSDSPQELKLPLTTKTPVTLDQSTPIAQALPLSTDLLHSDDYNIGPYNSEMQKPLRKLNALEDMYEDPYEERIRSHKESPDRVKHD